MRYLLTLILVVSKLVFSQGCSDAGFCTLGSLKPNQNYNKKSLISVKSIEVSQYFGMVDFKKNNQLQFYDYFLSYIADLSIGVGQRNAFQFKLPYNLTLGRLANTQGLGDVSLSWTRLVYANTKSKISIVLGAKLPTSFANIRQNESQRPLPMYYQPSLGTFDLVFGTSWQTKNWLFATGVQLPLVQNIQNQFVWTPWNATQDSLFARTYPRSHSLKRGNDLMLRVEKNFRFTNWNVFLGVLPILRLNEDEFFNPTTQQFETVKGSSGLATTLLSGMGYRIRTHSSIKALFGYRVTKRDFNPDGLSRIFVTTLGYEYLF
ncbi:MAG: hypothetical protein SNJ77_01005 [Cytophagales bacterium]